MDSKPEWKIRIIGVLLVVFTLTVNALCGMFVIPLFNEWRPTQPNLGKLASNPYRDGSWENSTCFSSRASDSYFSRVKESGVGFIVEQFPAKEGPTGHKRDLKMHVNRGGVDFIEKAVIVNGCIESFLSDPL